MELTDSNVVSHNQNRWVFSVPTLPWPWRCRLGFEGIFLRAPFKNLLIPLALDTLLITLLADRLRFVTFQSLFFAGPASYGARQHLCDRDKVQAPLGHVPSRLFVCLGLD